MGVVAALAAIPATSLAPQQTSNRASAGPQLGFMNLGKVKCGEFCVNVEQGIKQVFPAAGYQLFSTDGNLDANTMLANAKLMVGKKVKLYLDFDGGITNYKVTIAEMAKAHIPLFLLAGGPPPKGTKNVWWFGSNSYESGVADAKAVIAHAKAHWGGKIDGIFSSWLSSWSDADKGRVWGFADTLHKFDASITRKSITLYDGTYAGEKIQAAASAFLTAHTGQTHLVFFTPTSDEDGVSIKGAMQQNGRTNDAVIVTIGGDKVGRAELRDKSSPIIAEIGYAPETWGKQLLPLVKQILAGKHPAYAQYYDYVLLTKANIRAKYGNK
jgi:ABC-type sugar transport system substrate-binding protein